MNILWLGEPACQELALVGGKAANLSSLWAHYRIPHGFCATTKAYQRWAHAAEEDGCPDDFCEELEAAYQQLGERCGEANPRVAVRSSAVDEDGRAASFAGQYETFLNLSGPDAVIDAVMRCWASMKAERAIQYREKYGLPTEDVHLAVLVQHLVPADVSAVVFSANPVTRDWSQVMINASWGLGESIVGGTVTPDTYVVNKNNQAISECTIAEKTRMTISVPGGTEEVAVPRFMRSGQVLDEAQIVEMAHLACDLETRMRWPVDLECALKESQLYLLQCRPITTLAGAE